MTHTQYMLQEQVVASTTNDWLTFAALLLLLAYAAAKMIYPRYWKRFQMAIVYPIEGENLLHEKNTNLNQLSLWLNILSVFSLPLFISISLALLPEFLPGFPPVNKYLVTWMVLLVLTLLKFSGTWFIGYLFKSEEVAAEYNHTWLIYFKFFGFVLLFWSLLLMYLPDSVSVAALVGGWMSLIIMFILHTIKGFALLAKEGISLLYGILYLCCLEFLPILMIVRMIIS